MKKGQTILLVDYNKEIIDTVRSAVEQTGLRLILAEDGQEAFDIAKAEVPDLVIVRKDIPVLDALSMSVLLKQSPETKDIPVVVIWPAGASSSDLNRLQEAGCSGYIEEPFSLKDLLKKLEDCLT
ncbi:MAG: response regulator [Nitrospiraceae bacterium]|nr:response regulator [Nitrospiraceae bacterium]